jgi:hypothetical protein
MAEGSKNSSSKHKTDAATVSPEAVFIYNKQMMTGMI